eukprot:scaffold13152_cov135-Isochrysis_galbana.AAC.1
MEEYDEPELPVAPDDLERDALPSDDESGPENPDPESFADRRTFPFTSIIRFRALSCSPVCT